MRGTYSQAILYKDSNVDIECCKVCTHDDRQMDI